MTEVMNVDSVLSQLSQLIEQQLATKKFESALFWAEKQFALRTRQGNGNASLVEVAEYIRVLIAAEQWQTVLVHIASTNINLKHFIFSYYHVMAMYKMKKFNDIVCLPIGHFKTWESVELVKPEPVFVNYVLNHHPKVTPEDSAILDGFVVSERLEARLLFYLSDTYLQLQNRESAAACIRHSIRLDPLCYESIMFAIKTHLVSHALIREALISADVKEDQKDLFKIIHITLNYNSFESDEVSPELQPLEEALSNDLALLTAKAYKLYLEGHIADAYEITNSLVDRIGYTDECVMVHTVCLVEMRNIVKLYELSHKLVTMDSESYVSWYTVGCYYYAASQYNMARKFFNKCTQINPNFGFGWMAFGHVLSLEKEHDQALSCYVRASRLLENYAEPILYIGIEHCFNNNIKHALEDMKKASEFSGKPNPMVLHELATVQVVNGVHKLALTSMLKALQTLTGLPEGSQFMDLPRILEPIIDPYWSSLYFNMGYVFMTLERYFLAIGCFRKVVQLEADSVMAYAHIGFCYLNLRRIRPAMRAFHSALVLDDSCEMVKDAYDDIVDVLAKLPPYPRQIVGVMPDDLIPKDLPTLKIDVDTRPNTGRSTLQHGLKACLATKVEKTFQENRRKLARNRAYQTSETPTGFIVDNEAALSEPEISPVPPSTVEDEDRPLAPLRAYPTVPEDPAIISDDDEDEGENDDEAMEEAESGPGSIDDGEGGSRHSASEETIEVDDQQTPAGRQRPPALITDPSNVNVTPDVRPSFVGIGRTRVVPRAVEFELSDTSLSRDAVTGRVPVYPLDDNLERMSNWFMQDMTDDRLHDTDDHVSLLRPSPPPQRRDTPSDGSYASNGLNGSPQSLTQSRTRGRRQQT